MNKSRILLKLIENTPKFVDISQFKVKDLFDGSLYVIEKSWIRKLGASQFSDGDVIKIVDSNKKPLYYVYIKYGEYDTPALKSFVTDSYGKNLSSIAGSSKGFTPYYIDDFKNR